MRVVRVRETGPPEVLRLEEAEAPRPAAGEVVVAVEVAGVVFGDTIVRAGRYPVALPWVPGLEVGGRIAEVGPGADPSLTGRRVVATTLGMAGGYAESALARVDDVFEVPDGLPLDHAVAVFQAGAIAAGILTAASVGPDDTVLVTAAAGRIGSLLVQLAKAAGARVIGVAGEAKLGTVAEFGADVAIGYGENDWSARVRAETDGLGASVVLDAVGGAAGGQAIESAADGIGRIGVYGFSSGTWTALDTRQIGRRGLTVIGVLGVTFAKPAAEQRADAEHALEAAHAGHLQPRIHAAYPLADAARAHADLEARRNVGAVVLTASR